MEFSKKQQNKHYGWVRLYPLLLGAVLIALPVIFEKIGISPENIPETIFFIATIACGVAAIIVCVWLCFEVFTYGKNQTQYFTETGKLEIVVEKAAVLLWSDKSLSAILKYSIEQISLIKVTRTHIILIGKVRKQKYYPIKGYRYLFSTPRMISLAIEPLIKKDFYPVPVSERTQYSDTIVNKAYVPRNFTNENLITELVVEKYNANNQ